MAIPRLLEFVTLLPTLATVSVPVTCEYVKNLTSLLLNEFPKPKTSSARFDSDVFSKSFIASARDVEFKSHTITSPIITRTLEKKAPVDIGRNSAPALVCSVFSNVNPNHIDGKDNH